MSAKVKTTKPRQVMGAPVQTDAVSQELGCAGTMKTATADTPVIKSGIKSAPTMHIAPLTAGPDEIAAFITSVYDSYPHGSSFVPRWTGAFLQAVVFDHPSFTPDHALGAYIGDKLVGLIMAQPYHVSLQGTQHQGIYGSWLAITREGAAQFAAVRLLGELKERLAARGVAFMVGVAYRSGPGVGLDFWESYARAYPKDISAGQKLTFWARVLDGAVLAGAVKDPLLKLGGQAARLVPVRQPKANQAIRAFCNADLPACQGLFAKLTADLHTAPLRGDLTATDEQAAGPHCLVHYETNKLKALAMFHLLPMEDKKLLTVGIIDHLVADPAQGTPKALLAATLWHLKQAGACLALLPQKPDISAASMIVAGFVPYAAGFKMFMLPYNQAVKPQMPASFDLLVR